jgi:FXSXX-COOH protein
MSDDLADIDPVGVQELPPARLAELGDSALGHAVRRLLRVSGKADGSVGAPPIALFQDCL